MTFGDDRTGVEPAADYDRFVDWDKRLKREAPFFQEVFAGHAVRRVVDVGCGTGRHAVMWAEWGLDVVGVDPSESMLAQARETAREHEAAISAAGGSLRLAEGGFGELGRMRLGPVDAVTCTGNAIPHVEGLAGLGVTLDDFAAVLRPGGVTVIHLLDHDRILAKGLRTMPPVVREDRDGTWVFLRVMDPADDGIRFDFVTLHRPVGGWDSGAGWETTSRRSLHAALPSTVLTTRLAAAGFDEVSLFGDHAFKTFDPEQDESLIVVARRGPA